MPRVKSSLPFIKEVENENSTSHIYSPVSSITEELKKSCLFSPTDTPKARYQNLRKPAAGKVDQTQRRPDEENCTNEKGLFKNAFKLKSTPDRSSVKTKVKARRLLGMASRRLSSPETMSPLTDKENGSAICSPINQGSSSPQKILALKKSRLPLEDCDPNSQDSGYGVSYEKEEHSKGCSRSRNEDDGFRFAQPSGVAPRRSSVESTSRSPMRSPLRSSPSNRARAIRPALFRSLSSGYESTDDGFNELIDMDTLDEATQLPTGMSNLLSGDIVSSEKEMECDVTTTPEYRTKKLSSAAGAGSLRRSLSMQNERPEKSARVRSCLFRSPNSSSSASKLTFDANPRSNGSNFIDTPEDEDESTAKTFKRPEPPTELSPILVKRCKKSNSLQELVKPIEPKPAPLQRSLSETEANIKSAVHRSTTLSDLTGDFSKTCILPLATGDHEDLKSISTETLAGLIRGDFRDQIGSFKIVDCRYPYEFEGGHIEGAVNLYSKDMIEQILLNPLTHTPEIQPDTNKRSILVFHCEFSWERGPNLSRFLRNIDRQRNKEHYPALHYPEVYLLHGGYEQFYREQKDLCKPQGYRPMRHPDHEADLKQFRIKSKSWQGEKSRINVNGLTARANLKRLGF